MHSSISVAGLAHLHRSALPLLVACAVLGFAAIAGAAPVTATSSVIFEFNYFTDQGQGEPEGGLVADSQGRLYGTTAQGGASNDGTVYMLTPPTSAGGVWTEQILHGFGGADGEDPTGTLALGSDGAIYGTTFNGGANNQGVVYKLANTPGWPETILHSFNRNAERHPSSGVVFGQYGLLYGTTTAYQYDAKGTDFVISPLGDSVKYRVLNVFPPSNSGYFYSSVGLSTLPSGNGLLGATSAGNYDVSASTVYGLRMLSPTEATGATLYTFGPPPDVAAPQSPPIAGQFAIHDAIFGCNAYGGSTASPGTNGFGGIYRLTPTSTGAYAETVLYSFGSKLPDAYGANGCDIVQGDANGTLFGVTDGSSVGTGGYYGSDSTFFTLAPPTTPGGSWTENVLLYFDSSSLNQPEYPLVRMGNKYYVVFYHSPSGGSVVEVTVNSK